MATPLYRDYDRAALDIQCNARATVPDYSVITRQYAEESRRARETLPCILDVAYGEHADETLDIFPAAGNARRGSHGGGSHGGAPHDGQAPVFVFLHGGYWRLLSKDDSSSMAPAFTRAIFAQMGLATPKDAPSDAPTDTHAGNAPAVSAPGGGLPGDTNATSPSASHNGLARP
jgi:hypothetical protein